jgi:hypothetical protein
MQRQVAEHAPGVDFICLSDIPVPGVDCIPLEYDWPGWWSKLEVFRPDLHGDLLFTDLDNVILGDLTNILTVRDHYVCQRRGWTALMYIPERLRAAVWEEWIRDPAGHMETWQFNDGVRDGWGDYGDAGFISAQLDHTSAFGTEGGDALYWEDLLPGQVVNIAEILGRNRRATARDRDNLRTCVDASVRYLRLLAPKRDDSMHAAMYARTYEQLILVSTMYVDAGGSFDMPDDLPVPDGDRWPSVVPRDVRVLLAGQPRRPWKLPMFRHFYAAG